MQIITIPKAQEADAQSFGSNGGIKLRGLHVSKIKCSGGEFILINPVNTKRVSRNFSIFLPATQEAIDNIIAGMRTVLEKRAKKADAPITPGKGVECWGKNRWNKLCGMHFEKYKIEKKNYLMLQPINTKGVCNNFHIMLPPTADVVDELEKGLIGVLAGKTHKLKDHPLEWEY